MTTLAICAAFAGLDWASDHHDLVIVNPSGLILAKLRFDHTAAAWAEAIALLRSHQTGAYRH